MIASWAMSISTSIISFLPIRVNPPKAARTSVDLVRICARLDLYAPGLLEDSPRVRFLEDLEAIKPDRHTDTDSNPLIQYRSLKAHASRTYLHICTDPDIPVRHHSDRVYRRRRVDFTIEMPPQKSVDFTKGLVEA